MRSTAIVLFLATALLGMAMAPRSPRSWSGTRVTTPLDSDWRFVVGDPAGAEKPELADADWKRVTLPHDWSIEGPFDQKNPTRASGAFLPSGVAWYRRTLELPAEAKGKRVFVELDGVMQNSDVWINGHLLGHRPYGYVSFRYELTDWLQFGPGARNVLAVRADTSQQPASRWYTGAGIYRHVRLVTTDAVHLEPWSTFVATRRLLIPLGDSPPNAKPSAVMHFETRVVNQSEAPRTVSVACAVVDPHGKTVATVAADAQTVAAGQAADFKRDFEIADPAVWDVAHPQLYRLEVGVLEGKKALDDESVRFGVREFAFEPKTGFWLNGRNVRLYGVCLHHDGGAFGAAVPLAIWEQRLKTLRTLGVNAIRTAHNPPDPRFLDLCDDMGFLVTDEMFDCWTVGKNPYDYHLFFNEWSKIDTRDTVRRDRNHPSIILYSAGNEIHDTPQEDLAKGILQGLVEVFHENDPTRPVTQALFRPNTSHDYTNGLADLLDVVGTNYRDRELLAAWRAKPTRKIIDTEQRHDRSDWLLMRDNPQIAGQFLWSGVDYLGEAFVWPRIGSSSGLLDRTGTIKPMARERQSWWSRAPMVAMVRRIAPDVVSQFDPGYEPTMAFAAARRGPKVLADWSPSNRGPHDENVEVYSNCETVELFLNGKSLGAQPLSADASPRTWKVPFEPGTVRAVARDGGKDVAIDELKTAGAAARIVLTPDRDHLVDVDDVVRVTATVVDANGVPVPTADHLVAFSVTEPGLLRAVDNGDNASHESFRGNQRHAFQGRCVAFISSLGRRGAIAITATADGLESGKATIQAVVSD